MRKVIIFGGSGFIGRHLIDVLIDDYKILVFTRNIDNFSADLKQKVDVVKLELDNPDSAIPYFEEADGIINLAGENIGGGKWTTSFKDKIRDSRLSMARFIQEIFLKCTNRPSFFIQGSAIGYYGITYSDDDITEDAESKQNSFLANIAVHSEMAIKGLEILTRIVYCRTGIVLDHDQGALPKMAKPFKKYVGGKIGNGKQWISWIHIEDLVRGIKFVIENETISDAVNLTAPHPVTQKAFAKSLGHALKKPSFMATPGFVLELVLGMERAQNLLLNGVKVIPDKLNEAEFKFKYEFLEEALKQIYPKQK